MPREKYKSKSLKLKMALIKVVDSGGKRKDIAVKYGIPQSILTTTYKSKDKIFSCYKFEKPKTPYKIQEIQKLITQLRLS